MELSNWLVYYTVELLFAIHFNQPNTQNLIIARADTKLLDRAPSLVFYNTFSMVLSYPNTSQSQHVWITQVLHISSFLQNYRNNLIRYFISSCMFVFCSFYGNENI